MTKDNRDDRDWLLLFVLLGLACIALPAFVYAIRERSAILFVAAALAAFRILYLWMRPSLVEQEAERRRAARRPARRFQFSLPFLIGACVVLSLGLYALVLFYNKYFQYSESKWDFVAILFFLLVAPTILVLGYIFKRKLDAKSSPSEDE